MGFNKRYFNKQNIISWYDSHNIEDVYKYIYAPDACISEDSFSSKCIDIVNSQNTKEIKLNMLIKFIDLHK